MIHFDVPVNGLMIWITVLLCWRGVILSAVFLCRRYFTSSSIFFQVTVLLCQLSRCPTRCHIEKYIGVIQVPVFSTSAYIFSFSFDKKNLAMISQFVLKTFLSFWNVYLDKKIEFSRLKAAVDDIMIAVLWKLGQNLLYLVEVDVSQLPKAYFLLHIKLDLSTYL